MCGRFVQLKRRRDYEAYLKARAARDTGPEEERASWNVPPSTPSWVVRQIGGALRVDRLIWGMTTTGSTGARLVSNARVESAADKPLFRDAWQACRCLVPVEGWYEWQTVNGARKQPYFFHAHSDEPVLLAGLWTGNNFVLLTAATHGALATVHTRRPVVIPPQDAQRWCDPLANWTPHDVEQIMTTEDAFAIVPVSDAVNSTRQDGPALIRAIDPSQIARPDSLLPGF